VRCRSGRLAAISNVLRTPTWHRHPSRAGLALPVQQSHGGLASISATGDYEPRGSNSEWYEKWYESKNHVRPRPDSTGIEDETTRSRRLLKPAHLSVGETESSCRRASGLRCGSTPVTAERWSASPVCNSRWPHVAVARRHSKQHHPWTQPRRSNHGPRTTGVSTQTLHTDPIPPRASPKARRQSQGTTPVLKEIPSTMFHVEHADCSRLQPQKRGLLLGTPLRRGNRSGQRQTCRRIW
jgi:hypothetical protein